MWNIVRINSDLTLIQVGDPIPAGGEVIGQTIDPDALTPPEQPVPVSVSRFQARAALAMTERGGVNLFEAINGFMTALPLTDVRRRAWEDALEFERPSPTVAAIAAMFGMTDPEVDELFRLADTIKA